MSKIKNFFLKIGRWFTKHAPTKRKVIQVYAALLYNANIKGFVSGRIFHGDSKKVCVPGLNCYSCPGAVASCPLGALQNALNESNQTTPYYMLGILLLFGVIFGRTICGFLCPIGLLQEFAFKIRTPKVRKNKFTYVLSFFKWVLLVVFVIAIPIGYGASGYANPGFCKYFCPAGTLGGGYLLLLNPANASMFDMLGPLFSWKTLTLALFIIGSIFFYRFFCRFFCPLGLIYGLFNKFSLLGVTVNKSKCTNCGLCINVCRMDVRKVGDMECIQCGKCIDVCPEQAITWRGSKIFLHKDQLEPVQNNIKIDLVSTLPRIDGSNEVKPIVEETVVANENVETVEVETVKKPKVNTRKIKDTILYLNAENINIAAKLEYLENSVLFMEKELALPSKKEMKFRNMFREEISDATNTKLDEVTYSTFSEKRRERMRKKLVKFKKEIEEIIIKREQNSILVLELINQLPEDERPSLEAKPRRKKELYDPKKTKKFFIVLFSALTLITGTALIYYNFIETDPVSTGNFKVGSIPENFTVEVYNSATTYTFDSQKFDDKIIILNFWATWCGPCVAELPYFNQIQNDYPNDVKVVAIGDSNETEKDVESYINTNFSEMTLTFARDNENNEIFRKLGGKDSLPYTVVLNKVNKCVFLKEGKMDYETLKGIVTENL